jgi:hypothetical protein
MDFKIIHLVIFYVELLILWIIFRTTTPCGMAGLDLLRLAQYWCYHVQTVGLWPHCKPDGSDFGTLCLWHKIHHFPSNEVHLMCENVLFILTFHMLNALYCAGTGGLYDSVCVSQGLQCTYKSCSMQLHFSALSFSIQPIFYFYFFYFGLIRLKSFSYEPKNL